MNKTPLTEADLQAWVDGQLPPSRKAEVEGYLAAQPGEAERLNAYRAQRDALRQRLQSLAQDGQPTGQTGGFILRTNGEDASDAELAEDIRYLRKTWTRIREAAQKQSPKTLLHQDLSLLQRVLRDLVNDETQSIRIDSAEQFQALHAHLQARFPKAHAALKREVVGGTSLLYTWPGSDASLKPIALLAHQDVVPVAPGTEKDWQAEPYAGTIKDGEKVAVSGEKLGLTFNGKLAQAA